MDITEDTQTFKFLEFYTVALNSDIVGNEDSMTKDILNGEQEIYKTFEHAKIEAQVLSPLVKAIYNEAVHIYKIRAIGVSNFEYTDMGFIEADNTDSNMSNKEILDMYGFTDEEVNKLREEYMNDNRV